MSPKNYGLPFAPDDHRYSTHFRTNFPHIITNNWSIIENPARYHRLTRRASHRIYARTTPRGSWVSRKKIPQQYFPQCIHFAARGLMIEFQYIHVIGDVLAHFASHEVTFWLCAEMWRRQRQRVEAWNHRIQHARSSFLYTKTSRQSIGRGMWEQKVCTPQPLFVRREV